MLHYRSVREQAAAVRDGKITSLQLCNLHIARIIEGDAAVNADTARDMHVSRVISTPKDPPHVASRDDTLR